MALFAVLGSEFKSSILKELDSVIDERIKDVIVKVLRQVSKDYSLDYKEVKSRYCDPSSFDEFIPNPSLFSPPPETPPPPPSKKKKSPPSSSSEEEVLLPLSKMKKSDLVDECIRRGIDSDGTVSQLKERVKEARTLLVAVVGGVCEKKKENLFFFTTTTT